MKILGLNSRQWLVIGLLLRVGFCFYTGDKYHQIDEKSHYENGERVAHGHMPGNEPALAAFYGAAIFLAELAHRHREIPVMVIILLAGLFDLQVFMLTEKYMLSRRLSAIFFLSACFLPIVLSSLDMLAIEAILSIAIGLWMFSVSFDWERAPEGS